jgi:hypothetical protein
VRRPALSSLALGEEAGIVTTIVLLVLGPMRSAVGVDCNGLEIPTGCTGEYLLADCDENGVPDLCDPEKDCDRNGVADACDLESGAASDGNQNGIPDACEEGMSSFHITFRLVEPPEEPAASRAEVEVLLHSQGFTLGAEGARGWSLYVGVRGCGLVAATTNGTVAARVDADPPGLRDGGFAFNEVEYYCSPQNFGKALTQIALSNIEANVNLDPAESPQVVLRLTIEGRASAAGGCASCELRLVEVDPYCDCVHRGQPFSNFISLDPGAGSVPTYTPLTVDLCVPTFHRGDTNGDGRIDISDPISTFNSLFLGTPAPECHEAADSNDSGILDLSDGLFVLNYLFGQGIQPAPPPPGPPPEPCGSEDRDDYYSGCLRYSGC